MSYQVDDGSASNHASNVVTSTVSVTPVNDAPVLNANGGSLSYTENQAATAIDGALTVSDADSATLTGATVSITTNFASGEDVLGFTNQNGITGSYNSGTGVLTLSGSSSVANYQAALRSVTYADSSDNPSGLTRTVSYQVDDGSASNHASNVVTSTVSVTPVNDAPVLNANGGSLSYTENQAATAIDGALTVSDADSATLTGATVSITTNFASGEDVLGFTNQNGITGSYNSGTGVLTLSGSSSVANYQAALRSVTYADSSDNPSGLTRTVSYQVDDGSASNHASNVVTSTVSVTPVNDPAVISGDTTGSVVEAGGLANGTPGIPVATGALTDTDVDNLANTFQTVTSPTASDSGYGNYTVDVTGHWNYTLDNTNSAVEGLSNTQTLTDTFNVHTIDGTAQVVTVTIHGTNDVPVITGTATGSVTEDVNLSGNNLSTSGALGITDVDQGQSNFTIQASTPGSNGYGTFALAADGHWTYTADDHQTAIQQLGASESITDSFTAVSSDGTASQLVTVTIHGTNDVPVIGGVSTGDVTEDTAVVSGHISTSGALSITDVDQGQSTFTAQPSAAGTYGNFTLDAAGNWTYTADDSQTAIQQLGASDSITDSFLAASSDGTASQLVTVTIHGTNDAAVISGDISGDASEAGGVANGTPGTLALGTLTDTDIDNPPNTFESDSGAGNSSYGTWSINASGHWSYAVADDNSAVQALNVGDTLSDSFTVRTIDGTTQSVTVTIHGTNDAAVISGDISGEATEAGGVANGTAGTTATGTLTDTDVDNAANTFQVVASPTAGDSGYGNYTVDASGHWSYAVADGNSVVQALNVGDTLSDTFTIQTADGTAQVVTITIDGANDAAVISGDISGDATEAGGLANGTPGTTATGALTDTDVDNAANTFQAAVDNGDSGYGSYTVDASGNWVYTVADDNSAVQALNVGDTLSDSFTVHTVDGTAQVGDHHDRRHQ